ncbi:imidazolonepropionase-like amidohydrolase [Prauserella isguenensis]|uniref:Imidazolonepropionase-like amidohydrolase n=1 Tax=Prauserella isguenensis TaxID=1470180 RepID=A0A839S2K7_9PSEU|nr:amidohydrolase family protein [Prauserella isguenensis]MBB3051622.1 imidazolonepropionase-like amidohydrolase [Prauserella isguenensis]
MTATLLVRDAHVLDPEQGEYRRADLRCENGRVVEVDDRIRPASDIPVLDVHGGYVLPGLIDCHVHVLAFSGNLTVVADAPPTYVTAGAVRNMGAMLDRGFTTVRDTGGADFGLARAREEGLIRGPRLFYGGKALSQTGGHGDKRTVEQNHVDGHPCCSGTGRVVDGADEVRKAVREELRRGAHHVKLHASGGVSSLGDRIGSTQYSMDELRAAVDEVEAAGRYVTVHAYPPYAINRALEAGVHCVEHGNLLDDRTVELLLERDAFLVPTLVTYFALREEGRDHGLPQASWEKVGEVLDNGLGALETASRAGVRLAYGSDLLGGMQRRQNEEFRIRAQVQRPLDVIRAATTNAAALVGMRGELGTLAPGAHADLVVLDEDPLADVTVLADPGNIRTVVQGARVVRSEP